MRWDTDKKGKKGKTPSISIQKKYRIIVAFRLLQRCRQWNEWKAFRDKFIQRLEDIIYDRDTDFEVSDREKKEISDLMKESAKDIPDDPKEGGDPEEEVGGCTWDAKDWPDEGADADPNYDPEAGEPDDSDGEHSDDGDAAAFAKIEERRKRQFDYCSEYFNTNWFTRFWIRTLQSEYVHGRIF